MAQAKKKNNMNVVYDAVFTVDSNWRITSFNEGAEAITGLKSGDVVGQDCHTVFNVDERLSSLCELQPSLAAGKAVNDFRLVVSRSGTDEKEFVLVTAIPLPDDQGRLAGAVVAMRQVTYSSLIYPLVLDSITDGVFTTDNDGRITSFNRAAEQITGWGGDELIGSSCARIFQTEGCDGFCKTLDDKESKPVINRTVSFRAKNGGIIPVNLSAAPLVDPAGEMIGGIFTFRDLTGTMQQGLILQSIADGVFTVDQGMRITSFNRAAELITGWRSEEVLGVQCSEVFHSSLCGETCILAQSLEQGTTSCNREAVFVKTKTGRTVPISISAAPLLDAEGNVIGGVETFRDITTSIQQDLVLESIADGVFTVDRHWKIVSFNRAAEQITGWSREDAIGKSCSEVFHSSICGESCAIAQSLYSGQPVANRSIFIRSIDGKRIPISISASPLLDHEGNVIGGVETFRDLSLLTALRKQLSKQFTFGEIISKSPAMQRIFTILPEIAHSDSNVLVLGESGTGKELIARAIHNSSQRLNGPFVAVNCGALPETLLESELFGYKAGAFTDAKHDRAGRFAAAEKGTLFLDEIGDIPAALQVKLLRVLQNKMYEPLGSNQPVKADVRIIAATHRDLQALVEEGIFREDLFYRLNVVKIHLPPLRERKGDIPMLVDHFVKQFSALKGKDIVGVSDEALAALMRYKFPGNIRELENIIEYAFILCHGGLIQPDHLPEPFGVKAREEDMGALVLERPQSLEQIEKQAIFQALERNQWKRLATCRELGISKDTLRRKISRYELQDPFGEEVD